MKRACRYCEGTGWAVDGLALRSERMSRALSLREVARRLNLSAAYIHDVELGKRRCAPALRRRFLRVCGRA